MCRGQIVVHSPTNTVHIDSLPYQCMNRFMYSLYIVKFLLYCDSLSQQMDADSK